MPPLLFFTLRPPTAVTPSQMVGAPYRPPDAEMLTAIDTAVANGATVVSMSFGTGNAATGKPSEPFQETGWDTHFEVPNVTFVASSADKGSGVGWPAASPYVIAVGGTTLSWDSEADGFRSAAPAWARLRTRR